MNGYIQMLAARADRVGSGGARADLVAWLVAGILLVGAGMLVGVDPLRLVAGSLAGLCWFSTGWVWLYAIAGDPWRTRLGWRGRLPLSSRRGWAVGVGLTWFGLVVSLLNRLPDVVAGAGTVAVLCGLWRFATATRTEADALEQERSS